MTEQELILTTVLDCRRVDLYVDQRKLTENQNKRIEEILSRRKNGEPLQYLLGFTEFMGLRINVNRQVLIPRPETEVLVEKALFYINVDNSHADSKQKFCILEIGSGSGNIAIALAKLCKNAMITSVEISQEALKVAKENAKMHQVEDKINFVAEDIHQFIQCDKFKSKFDMIISNPPYIPSTCIANLPLDVQQEPHLALDGGLDGLNFYRLIINKSKELLREDGVLAFEFGDGQAADIKQFYLENSFSQVEINEDLAGKQRIIFGRLTK